ncbi:MAG: phage tail tube protein [Filifactoraceae bacterium]
MGELRHADTINGSEGTASMTIDGRRYNLINLKNIEIKRELIKSSVRALGQRIEGQKVTGAKISGSATAYWNDDIREIAAEQYLKTGIWPEISIQVFIEDPSSRTGSKIGVAKGVIFDSNILFQSKDGVMEESFNFSANSYESLKKFNLLEGM